MAQYVHSRCMLGACQVHTLYKMHTYTAYISHMSSIFSAYPLHTYCICPPRRPVSPHAPRPCPTRQASGWHANGSPGAPTPPPPIPNHPSPQSSTLRPPSLATRQQPAPSSCAAARSRQLAQPGSNRPHRSASQVHPSASCPLAPFVSC
jgi:hypothetical protein